MSALLLTHLACTWALVGLIWTIQVVHYPLFARVGPEGFTRYHTDHTRLITYVVAPLMVVEALSAAALVLDAGIPPALSWTGVALVGVVWLTTGAVSVPCHSRLSLGFDAEAHRRLVITNWIRTAAWTARGLLVLAIFKRS